VRFYLAVASYKVISAFQGAIVEYTQCPVLQIRVMIESDF